MMSGLIVSSKEVELLKQKLAIKQKIIFEVVKVSLRKDKRSFLTKVEVKHG